MFYDRFLMNELCDNLDGSNTDLESGLEALHPS